MIMASLVLAALFYYGKSKYFPEEHRALKQQFQDRPWLSSLGGSVLALTAGILCIATWGWLTGIWLWGIGLLSVFALVVILLPLHRQLLYALLGGAFLLLILDLTVQ
ncbi:MAG: hypothetical protein AAGN35_17990 [Bacteroidota bacterium]